MAERALVELLAVIRVLDRIADLGDDAMANLNSLDVMVGTGHGPGPVVAHQGYPSRRAVSQIAVVREGASVGANTDIPRLIRGLQAIQQGLNISEAGHAYAESRLQMENRLLEEAFNPAPSVPAPVLEKTIWEHLEDDDG